VREVASIPCETAVYDITLARGHNFYAEGIVVHNCSPCLNADMSGPYLPENVPTPGVVCVANGWCRCVIEFERAPEIAATL